ncbi:hypothetical protein BDV24DRAFT_166663 [Aspergillus arachidicola]|uniref:Uncharacterized protein n=1 Tax=Aspergillus arachidicola TaxID=656916 RepID=A0A5N6XYD3_9EURO|nr:hypothetical protein BDV24DRAFT_166663 [Aspergillus arachidicola]
MVLRRVFATVCVGDLLLQYNEKTLATSCNENISIAPGESYLLSLSLHFETDSTTSIEPYATAPSLNMAGPAAFPASSNSPTVSTPERDTDALRARNWWLNGDKFDVGSQSLWDLGVNNFSVSRTKECLDQQCRATHQRWLAVHCGGQEQQFLFQSIEGRSEEENDLRGKS